jgi:hypothetical protein
MTADPFFCIDQIILAEYMRSADFRDRMHRAERSLAEQIARQEWR